MAYCFTGYWEDISTIKTFFEANLKCCAIDAPFKFSGRGTSSVFTCPRSLEAASVTNSELDDCIVSFGSDVESSELKTSIIGLRGQVRTRLCSLPAALGTVPRCPMFQRCGACAPRSAW